MKRVLLGVAGAALALALASCNRTHMGRYYGVSVRGALAAQVVDPRAGAPNVGDGGIKQEGLDPQEAAIVHDTYRKSLSPKGSDDAARRVPIVVVPAAERPAPQP